MKMMKSLLLGSAAGLVAVTGAQAADFPVKAKAVEYVKVCTLYGAGFYYIPGTDTCIKIGGFLRSEWLHNAAGSFAPYTSGTDGLQTRAQNPLRNRTRIIMTFDVRSQTEYGTLRAYARAGWQWTTADYQIGGSQCASAGPIAASNAGNISSPSGVAVGSSSCTYLDRAFIQFAGFTFGKTQSYFDFFNTGAYSLQTNWLWVDSGGSGTPVFAYTWQGGNGLSATISAEEASEQRQPVVGFNPALSTASLSSGGPAGSNLLTGGLVGFGGVPAFAFANCTAAGCDIVSPIQNYTLPIGGTPVSSAAGQVWPDIVGNIRVDQAWGSAQVMGAIHRVAATYNAASNFANTTSHPSDAIGWAGGGGITLNMPWDKRDTLSAMGTYCLGAVYYCSHPGGGVLGNGSQWGLVNTSMIGLGWQWDAVFNNNFKNILAPGITSGSLELSKSWSFVAAFEHYWTPALRSSVYGGYEKFQANSPTVDVKCQNGTMISNNIAVQTFPTSGTNGLAVGSTGQVFGPGCLDWSAWELGTRSIWNPVANLDIGVDVMYTKVNTALAGANPIPTGGTGLNGSTGGGSGLPAFLLGDNTHIWSAVLRIQRNFWP